MAERAAKQLELNKSELPNSITEVIATLNRAGFDAYIVGGVCVIPYWVCVQKTLMLSLMPSRMR